MSSTINAAQWRVWANLLERELAGKPSSIQQIDVERDGGHIIAWFYFPDDDCFAVSFKPALPMPDSEVRSLITRWSPSLKRRW
jgi:hypothetical protein